MPFSTKLKYYLNRYILESMQRKLMVTLLLVMMVPLLIFMLVSTHISRGAVESSEISSNQSRMELSKSYIEEQLNWFDDFLFTALVDENLVPSITTIDNITTTNSFNTQSYIQDKLFALYNGNDHILSVTLTSYEDKLSYKVEQREFFVTNMKASAHQVAGKDSMFSVNSSTKSFTFGRNIYRFEDQKLVGRIDLKVSFDFISPIAGNLQSNMEESIVLVDSKGNQLFTLDENGEVALKDLSSLLDQQQEMNYFTLNQDYYFYQEMMDKRIVLIKVVPEEVMMVGSKHIGQTGLLILLISICFTIILSIFISNQVAKPIVLLTKKMEHVEENNFNVKINSKRTDEIGILQRKFKEMIDRIRDLIEKDYKREMENRDAQFLALQSQINPHFLYNTLQVVSGMALKKGAKEIYEMIQKLGGMFRYITNKRGDLVFIWEEVQHLQNYLYIQKVRFGENISIDLFVDEQAKDAIIPLLTLQPIVENSFKHGFESQVEKGFLKIDIQKVFDEIEVVIEDNGMGMTEEVLQQLKDKLLTDSYSHHRSIGLKNVDTRMKLYFGREYGVEITSQKSQFTKVLIRMPYQKGSEHK
ncbi:sensor histidine kinase [Metabacillus schmidteae]|uniref:sensor histidine kinase n=1 Tax=Metabacillus schmidteae TaxID=2730405 RepID=UPI00158C7210|nr:sensor histidine kinase [Metabacillus schmidteae]